MQVQSAELFQGIESMKLAVLGTVVAVSLATSACCHDAPNVLASGVDVAPNSAATASQVLNAAIQRYRTVRTYRDHGVILSIQRGATIRSTAVHYFDTVFVRDHGLRLRLFDERREVTDIVWVHGDSAEIWRSGSIAHPLAVPTALATAKATFSFASELVPSLLLGLRPLDSEYAAIGREIGTAGIGMPPCGKCWNVAFGSRLGGRQHAITIDAERAEVRRLTSFTRFATERPEATDLEQVANEDVVLYEPEFDLEAQVDDLIREVETRPWRDPS